MLYCQTFVVEGAGEFPHDMLREDCCYPLTASDSGKLSRYFQFTHQTRQVSLVRLVRQKGDFPNRAAWKSHGWSVIEETIESVRIKLTRKG
jgi:hypothetical protein